MADSKENYQLDLGSERVMRITSEIWGVKGLGFEKSIVKFIKF